MSFYERNARSIVKTISFRVVIILADTITIFVITRRYDITLSILVISNLTSTILYFLHERAWNGVHWGKRSA